MSSPPPNLSETHARELRAGWVAFGLTLVIIAYFLGFVPRFGPGRAQSAIAVWTDAWNKESDFEHGWMFPPLMLGLLHWKRKEFLAARAHGGMLGLVLVTFGAALFVLAFRAIQWRMAIIGLPFLLTGSVWYLWGHRAALLTAFPFFLTWLAIPVGFLQQATSGLQLLASKLAHAGSSLAGVQTTIRGNILTMGSGSGFAVDEGCSGIRSLWALMLLAAAWSYLARMPLWKRCLLFVSAFPIAILGNSLRLISIFIIAEYGNEHFAAHAWHDWSSLLLFYPISLCLLLAVHAVLEGGVPWGRSKKAVRRTIVTSHANTRP
jgi:exosortase